MKRFFKLCSVIFFLPSFALAQATTGTTAQDLIIIAAGFFKQLPTFFIGIIIIFIVWYGVQYARSAGGKDEAKYRSAMLISIGILAVAFSIFGIISILQNTIFGSITTQNGVQILKTGR